MDQLLHYKGNMADQGNTIDVISYPRISPANCFSGLPTSARGYYNQEYALSIERDFGNTVIYQTGFSIPNTNIQYFKIRGYYVAGSTYEVWISQVVPNLTPPSGHTLTNITIVSTWR